MSKQPRLVRSPGSPAFQQLKQLLRDGILDGSLGERLPSERELARRHGIAYMTARRAIDALDEEGLVRRVPGRGTFACRGDAPVVRSGNIGIVLSPTIRHGAANPYYGEIVAAVLDEARQAGLSTFVAAACAGLLPRSDDPASRRKIDGIIAMGGDPVTDADLLRAADFVPVVRINGAATHPRMAAVAGDDAGGGAALAAHLIARGYRRIAWIGNEAPAIAARRDGFAAGLAAAGIDLPAAARLIGDLECESGERECLRLLARGEAPEVVACGNDAMACGALRALLSAGRRVPHDVSVTGFDGLILDGYLPLRLTTVAVDKRALARAACAALLRLVDGEAPAAGAAVAMQLRPGETTR